MSIEVVYGSDWLAFLWFAAFIVFAVGFIALAALVALAAANRASLGKESYAAPTPYPWPHLALRLVGPGAALLLVATGFNLAGHNSIDTFSDTASQLLAQNGTEVFDADEVDRWVRGAIKGREAESSHIVLINIDGEPAEAILRVNLEVENREGVATLRLDDSLAGGK